MIRAFSATGLSLALLLGARVAPAAASDTGTGAPDPRALGRVVILPFIDRTVEGAKAGSPQDQETRQRQEAQRLCLEMAHFEVEARFRMYGIEYVKRPELAAALAALKLDPTREGDRARTRLKALADHLKARYVVSGVIQDAEGSWRRRGLLGEGKAEAEVQFQVFDAREERHVTDLELTGTAESRGKTLSSRSFSRTAKLRIKVVRDATQKAMAAFLRPYPMLYAEDPGEAFVVYPTRRETETTSAAPTTAPAPPPLPTKPVVFKLANGTKVEGTIDKFENGFYTVTTAEGRVTIAQEHVISMTELK